MVRRIVFVSCLAALLAACSLPSYYNDYDSRFAWHNEFHFLTPADRSPSLGNDYTFVVVSDIHVGGAESAMEFAALKDKLIPGDRFVVVTGDITGDGTREQLRLFIDAADDFKDPSTNQKIPCYPVIGNHDIYESRGAAWRELIGSSIYRINVPGTSLFILDNANAALGYDQIQWLEGELKTAEKNTFVFAHENLFVNGSPPDFEQTTDIQERAKIMSMLKNRCYIMFTGHLHKRIVKEFGGGHYITLEAYGSSEAAGTFCRVSVSENNVSWEFVK